MSEYRHVRGLRDLARFLDQFPAKVERTILRSALRAGAKVILAHARASASSVSGRLRASMRVSTGTRGGQVSARVVAGGADAFYARFVEYGTKPHTITAANRGALSIGGLFFQSVDHPGARARPFMRPAMDTQAQPALVATGEYIKARLTKAGLDASGVELSADD